jgi:IS5 family transposase
MMAKLLLLQSLYNLGDDAMEYQVNDRLSFKRFLGLSVTDKSPDAKSIWLWRERIKHGELEVKIFQWFAGELQRHGYTAKGGQIVDATFVPTHKPTGKQNTQLKEGIPLTPRQMQQRDVDADFTKKGNITHHGYKDHIVVDVGHKFIRDCATSPASLHDSQCFAEILVISTDAMTPEDSGVWADSAYRSAEAEAMLEAKGLISHVHERAYRNTPLSDAQKAANKERSRVRARIEHVFGHMETAMGGMMVHTIGRARAHVKNVFKNTAYNMQRFVMLERRKYAT